MNLLGENFVKLIGKITYKNITVYGDNSFFRCKLAVPIDDKFQYIKISVWGTMAESLGELNNGTWIKLHGHIEESSYDAKCKYCQAPTKNYWTTVVVDNYITLQGDLR